MITCFKCGHENDPSLKYCEKCNALLPKQAPTGIPSTSTMDLAEEIDYPRPEGHYQSPFLEHLAWAVHDFLEENGEIEPVFEGYEAYQELFENFRAAYPQYRETTYGHKSLLPDDPFPSKFNYLLATAENFYEAGKTKFEGYFEQLEAFLDKQEDLEKQLAEEEEALADDELDGEAEPSPTQIALEELEPPESEPLVGGVRDWLECNDHVCMALEALTGWLDGFQPMADQFEQELAEAAAAAGNDLPTDSTDLG